MTLKQFADLAGCVIIECGPGWGGRYGYTTKDAPECHFCGYKTKSAARKRWMADTFGPVAGKAIEQLLEGK